MAGPGESFLSMRNGERITLHERDARRIAEALNGGEQPPEFFTVRERWRQNEIGLRLIRSDGIDHVFHLGKPRVRKKAAR